MEWSFDATLRDSATTNLAQSPRHCHIVMLNMPDVKCWCDQSRGHVRNVGDLSWVQRSLPGF